MVRKPPTRKKIEIRTHCPECGYRHQKGRTAGFFVRLGFNGGRYDDDDSADDGGGGAAGEEIAEQEPGHGEGERKGEETKGDDEEHLHRPMTPRERHADSLLRQELGPPAARLNTPHYIRSTGYVRCNCITGVPPDVLGWLPVQHPRFVGGIELAPKDLEEKPRWVPERGPPPAEALELVVPFLDGRSAGRACLVSPEWRAAGRKSARYADLHSLEEEVARFMAHKDDVVEDMIPYYGGVLFTAGNRSVKCWKLVASTEQLPSGGGGNSAAEEAGLDSYEHISTPIEDTSAITSLLPSYDDDGNGLLYTASRNGYIRRWTVNPSPPSEMTLSRETSEHQRQINAMVPCLPTVATDGFCPTHGLWNHSSCRFFTGSDDRSIAAWDALTGECLDRIETPSRRSCTVQALEVSDRHLFAGTSMGTILVYPLGERVCERVDTHLCTETPEMPVRWCLQTELHHGGEGVVVKELKVGGPCFAMEYLFSGGGDGTVAVFRLPTERGSLDFQRVATLRGHELGVTCMAFTWSHLYTGADDGTIRMWELSSVTYPFCFQRSLDAKFPGGVRCICVEEEGQRSTTGVGDWGDNLGGGDDGAAYEWTSARYLYVGLASGEVQKWRLGDWV